jgi:phenylalanyl-tRNA synthetase alpha subunit
VKELLFQIGEKCDENFGQTTSIILSGSDESVSKAKELIEDFLNSFVSKSSGNRGNHSYFQRTETASFEPELEKPEVIDWAEVHRKCVSGI